MYSPHPEIAKQLGVPGNDECVCATPLQAMACPFGHMLECHYPKDCREAMCSHFLASADPDWYPELDDDDDYILNEDLEDDEPICELCGEYLDECQCDDDDDDL